MRHHIVYWRMARREVDVDDAELADLREQELRGELYVEFLDGRRLPLAWDHDAGRWISPSQREPAAAAA